MAQVRWTKQAMQDLEAIGDYIARDAPEIVQIFFKLVEPTNRHRQFG